MLRQVEDIARWAWWADSRAGGSTSKAEERRRLTALLTHPACRKRPVDTGTAPAVVAALGPLISTTSPP